MMEKIQCQVLKLTAKECFRWIDNGHRLMKHGNVGFIEKQWKGKYMEKSKWISHLTLPKRLRSDENPNEYWLLTTSCEFKRNVD